MRYRIYVISLVGGLFLATAPLAFAKPLTRQECGELRNQKLVLANKGLAQIVAKGAVWAAANLEAARMEEVGTYINLMENIRFRCGNKVSRARNKSGWPRMIELPVRNSLRLRKRKDEQDKASLSPVSAQQMAPEIKAVISTKATDADGKSGGAGQSTGNPPVK